MKINLLSNEEARQVKTLNNCILIINDRVREYTNQVEDEVFSSVEKNGIKIKDMNNANIKLNKLIYEYNIREQSVILLITSSVFLMLSIMIALSAIINDFEIQNIGLFYAIACISIFGVPYSIRNLIIRKKIKKNLQQIENTMENKITKYLR